MIAKAIILGKKYYDFEYKAIFGISKRGHLGLIFRYQDPSNYYALSFSDKIISVVVVHEGKHTILKEKEDNDLKPGNWFQVQITAKRDLFKIRYKLYDSSTEVLKYETIDTPTFEFYDTTIYKGSFGIFNDYVTEV